MKLVFRDIISLSFHTSINVANLNNNTSDLQKMYSYYTLYSVQYTFPLHFEPSKDIPNQNLSTTFWSDLPTGIYQNIVLL